MIFAAGRSRQGASHALLRLLADEGYRPIVSVPLVLEYEMALRRRTELDEVTATAIVDFICLVADRQPIYYLWRPFLKDPSDEMVLEVAVGAGADAIVTHNLRDFDGVEEHFGIRVVTPRELLAELRETDQ